MSLHGDSPDFSRQRVLISSPLRLEREMNILPNISKPGTTAIPLISSLAKSAVPFVWCQPGGGSPPFFAFVKPSEPNRSRRSMESATGRVSGLVNMQMCRGDTVGERGVDAPHCPGLSTDTGGRLANGLQCGGCRSANFVW